MDAVVLNVLVITGSLGAGFAMGCLLRGKGHDRRAAEESRQQLRNQVNEATQEAKVQKKKALTAMREVEAVREQVASAQKEAEEAKEALSKLQKLAHTMAVDVSNHNTRVQEINDELGADLGPDNVVAAVAQLIEANQSMQKRLESAEERLANQAEQLKSHLIAARTDPLTKLLNRRGFDDELDRCAKAYEESGAPTSIVMIDVDHFKKVNDIHGHHAGDEVLRMVADVLREHMQGNEIVCRWGGEEFAVIFPGRELQQVLLCGERARQALGTSSLEFEGVELCVTASAGFAQFREGDTPAAIVRRADEALFASKESGRNRTHWHDGKKIHALSELPKEAPPEKLEEGTDRLTGLPLKGNLLAATDRRLAEWRRGGELIAVVMLEIDRFHTIANHSGFDGRDTLLKTTVQFLRATMRDMDQVARYDECQFAMLLPGASHVEAIQVGERLRKAIENCKLPKDLGIVKFTVSVGAAECTSSDSSVTLVERAEAAMRAATKKGGNLIAVGKESEEQS